ncbi:hypothetical protein FOZ60_003020 [Perkinsus olseni]|uniref:MIF4G domain-containing protein n=1 Tax=Perkinsus olseni TaxID=32597 RepID=A0A7J6PK39_PEROL|nr:hypothetical protein FOZ60_003020 [Perkinsus olseni]
MFLLLQNALVARRELLSMPRDPVDDVRKPPLRPPQGRTTSAHDARADANPSRWTLLGMMEEELSPILGSLLQFAQSGTVPDTVPLDPLPPPPPRNIPIKITEDVFRLRKKIRAILNKVTENNFERLSNELAKLELSRPWSIDLLLHMTVQRAIREPIFSELYARLLVEFRAKVVKSDGQLNLERVLFRDQLVHEIHLEFSEALIEFRRLFDIFPAGREDLLREIRELRRNEALQCMRLLGSFYCKGFFTLETLKKVAETLVFIPTVTPTPLEVECAITLLESTGRHLDSRDDRSRALCTCLLGRLVKLKGTLTECRLRILILNLEKQREFKWRKAGNLRSGSSEALNGGQSDKVHLATKKKKAQGRGSKFVDVFSEEGFRLCRDMYHEDGSFERFMAQVQAMVERDESCVRNMAELLLQWGSTAHQKKKSKEADLLTEMVRRGILPFELLDEILRAFLQDLDEHSAQTKPTYEFVEKLYAALLTTGYGYPEGPAEFDSALFLSWEALHSDSKAFDIGLGILQRVKERAGLEGVRKSLAALQQVAGPLAPVKTLSEVPESEGFWDPLLDHELDDAGECL